MHSRSPLRRHRGFSLLEALIALAILLIGLVALVRFFPPTMRASNDAVMKSRAALLAQAKMEELRRDADRQASLIGAISRLDTPTPALRFSEDERLVYQFCGRSVLDSTDTIGLPGDNDRTPRIIVRYAPEYDERQTVIFELRFDE